MAFLSAWLAVILFEELPVSHQGVVQALVRLDHGTLVLFIHVELPPEGFRETAEPITVVAKLVDVLWRRHSKRPKDMLVRYGPAPWLRYVKQKKLPNDPLGKDPFGNVFEVLVPSAAESERVNILQLR